LARLRPATHLNLADRRLTLELARQLIGTPRHLSQHPGMIANGYPPDFAERTFKQLEGFGSYGFPESHAAAAQPQGPSRASHVRA
jgi:DNA polymerase III alpha subunit